MGIADHLKGKKMEIRTFEERYLVGAKSALKSAFYRENSDETYNEWEFAERLPGSDGYIPELCIVALDGEKVIGYNALSRAEIGKNSGLALGPLGIRKEYQNAGAGAALVKECIRRAKESGYPWIAVLGGNYYSRFGFESCRPYGITVSDDDLENDHLQILFLNEGCRDNVSGQIVYCDAFYDADGNLL